MATLNLCRNLLLTVLILLLSGCGFAPRKPVVLAPPLQQLYIKSYDPYGSLSLNLKKSLQQGNITIADSPAGATALLEILSETKSQQLVSVGGTLTTQQYQLYLTLAFQLSDAKGQVILSPQTLTETRMITTQSSQILGGNNAISTLYKQMEQSLILQILNRIASKEVTNIVNHATKLSNDNSR